MNRLLHHIIRDGHLTFRKKWRDLIIKIFGHESLYGQTDLAEVAYCSVFDVDFYRLSTIKLKHLAYRKLLNPFKWVEFLITVPLELLQWSIQRFIATIAVEQAKDEEITKKKVLLGIVVFIISLISIFMHLAVNLTTGILRRVLAPVRYIIRPSIEFAKTYPKTFLTLLSMTLAITAMLAVSIFTGGLPLFSIGGILLASSIGIKIAAISGFFISAWAVLIKSVTTVLEFSDGIQRVIRNNKLTDEQKWMRVRTLNGERGYAVYTMYSPEMPKKSELDKNEEYKDKVPMLIRCRNNLWVYDANLNETKLTEVTRFLPQSLDFVKKYETKKGVDGTKKDNSSQNTVGNTPENNKPLKNTAENIPWQVYNNIAVCKGNFVKPTIGTTAEISRALHAINPELTEVKSVENQDACYTFALFTGTEALFFPKQQVAEQKALAEEKVSALAVAR